MILKNQILSDLRFSYWNNLEFDSLFDAIREARERPMLGSYYSQDDLSHVEWSRDPFDTPFIITHQIHDLRIKNQFIIGDIEFLKHPKDPLRNRFQQWMYLWAKGLKILPVIRASGERTETYVKVHEIYAWDYVPVDSHPRRSTWMNNPRDFFLKD